MYCGAKEYKLNYRDGFVFGYIRPQKSELLVREYEQYRGVYCALCKQLGDSFGIFSRMTLSYDCTFLALMKMGMSQERPTFLKGKCVANPLKKCTYCKGGKQILEFAAALSVILTYYKVRDDISDSRFAGRLRAFLALPFLLRSHKKAKGKYPELERIVAEAMELQQQAEQSSDALIDASAEPTAKMLSETFQLLSQNEKEKRVLEQFGYFLGRWVYMIDAADDLEADIKSGSFNPFVKRLGLTSASTPQELEKAKAYCNEVLNMTLSQAVGAFQLLEFQQFGKILSNVIFLGLPEMQRELLFLKEKEKKNV